jgi:fructose-1,6-bisphosphatase/inositol monophosphatase family enzyme
MMNIDMQKIEAAIREVAATEIMPRWRNLNAGDIAQKTGPDDLVTVADGASERALSAMLTALYPDSVVVGEEVVEANPATMDYLRGDKPVWVIDPIDGTMGFSKGQPEFDVMLALVQKGELLGGWIYAPVDNDFYMGEKGAGVMRIDGQGMRTTLSAPSFTSLKDFTGILGKKLLSDAQRTAITEKQSQFKGIISTVCAGHDYAKMLRGDAHFAYYGKNMPWDHLPGLAMLSMLGFHYTKQDGSAYRAGDTSGGIVVAPDKQSCDDIRRLFAG